MKEFLLLGAGIAIGYAFCKERMKNLQAAEEVAREIARKKAGETDACKCGGKQ